MFAVVVKFPTQEIWANHTTWAQGEEKKSDDRARGETG
jgi:hypothetical protein